MSVKKLSQKIVLICYADDDWKKSVPFSDGDQRASYESLYSLAEDEFSLRFVRASLRWFDGVRFKKYWEYSQGKWKKVSQPLSPDCVLDKAGLDYSLLPLKIQLSQQFLVLNQWEFDLLTSDKLLTETVFSAISVPSRIVRSVDGLHSAMKQLKAKEYIYKPRLGYGGKGVEFFTLKKLPTLKKNSLGIIQPVIDTQKGIPGVMKGYHDLRVVWIGSKATIAFVRTPAPGSRLCNISQGGDAFEVPLSRLPKTLKPLFTLITEQLQRFPERIYATDFFFGPNGKPYLIEMNAKPIIAFPPRLKKLEGKIQRAYVRYIDSLVRSV